VIDDGAPKPLTQAARAILFRAVRELLINVAKHAQVDAATVETARVDDRLRIRVNDAGVGFEPTRIESAPHGGLGLASVRERLTYLGGTVAIESIPGDGTVVELMAPLEPEPASAAAERTR
jgi:signal transduction histidine kinase